MAVLVATTVRRHRSATVLTVHMQHTAAKRPTPTAPTSYREQTAHRPAQHSAPETHTKITSYSGRPQRTRSVDQG